MGAKQHKKNQIIRLTPLALGLGILISPDTLIRLGNFMGNTGWTGLVLLTAVMVVFLFLAPGVAGQKKHRVWTYLPLTVKAFAATFLSTGVLVSSGFVFNEVFLYWFPNFGFAFLLLALVLAVHLYGIKTAYTTQVIWVSLTLISLLPLIISGLVSPDDLSPAFPDQLPGLSVFFVPLMLWVGVDLAALAPTRLSNDQKKSNALGLTIAVAGILFLLWGTVSVFQVPLAKLSGSSIPHLKAARSILGDPGRYLMGAVIIFGTLSCVNALFLACRISAGNLVGLEFFPRWAGRCVPILLSAVIGLMMAKGMAGSENLELWIQAVFILWLLSYSGIFNRRRKSSPANTLAMILIPTGAAFLLLTGEAWQLKTIYFLVILGIAWVPGILFTLKSSFDMRNK